MPGLGDGSGLDRVLATDQPLETGTVVGRYELVARCGAGAMGSVWKARHVELGHDVAIKFIHAWAAVEPDARARFEREARIAATLSERSRHVVKMSDYGVLPSGLPYLVMELLSGEDLQAALARQRRLPFDDAITIASQLCDALEVVHRAGIVHRDLKPANVFLVLKGEKTSVKLLDFGVAKAAALTNDPLLTAKGGAFLGSPNYMSPERLLDGGQVDERADLWAVAIITFQMIAGDLPFRRVPLEELAVEIIESAVPAPTSLGMDVPAWFDAWIAKGLAKDPKARFQTASEMRAALLRSDDAREGAGRPAEVTEPEIVDIADDRPHHGRSRASVAAIAITITIAIACGVAVVAWQRLSGATAERASASAAAAPAIASSVPSGGGSSATPTTAEAPASVPALTVSSPPRDTSAQGARKPPITQAPRVGPSRTAPHGSAKGSPDQRAAESWKKRDDM